MDGQIQRGGGRFWQGADRKPHQRTDRQFENLSRHVMEEAQRNSRKAPRVKLQKRTHLRTRGGISQIPRHLLPLRICWWPYYNQRASKRDLREGGFASSRLASTSWANWESYSGADSGAYVCHRRRSSWLHGSRFNHHLLQDFENLPFRYEDFISGGSTRCRGSPAGFFPQLEYISEGFRESRATTENQTNLSESDGRGPRTHIQNPSGALRH